MPRVGEGVWVSLGVLVLTMRQRPTYVQMLSRETGWLCVDPCLRALSMRPDHLTPTTRCAHMDLPPRLDKRTPKSRRWFSSKPCRSNSRDLVASCEQTACASCTSWGSCGARGISVRANWSSSAGSFCWLVREGSAKELGCLAPACSAVLLQLRGHRGIVGAKDVVQRARRLRMAGEISKTKAGRRRRNGGRKRRSNSTTLKTERKKPRSYAVDNRCRVVF